MSLPGAAVLLLLLAPLLIVLALTQRKLLFAALPIVAALNGIVLPVGGMAVRLDQLSVALLIAALTAAVAIRSRRLVVDRTFVLLVMLWLTNVLATALHAPARGYSVLQLINLASVWGTYVVMTNYPRSLADVDRVVNRFVVGALVASIIGVFAFISAAAGFPLGGANTRGTGTDTAAFGAYGTMVEPNIFGSYCASVFVLSAGQLLIARDRARLPTRVLWSLAAGFTFIGLLASFTRGAWLGAIVGIAALMAFSRRYFGARIPVRKMAITVVVVGMAATVLWFTPFAAGEFFRYKVRNLFNRESDTAAIRLVTFALALDHVWQHPIIGSGTYSFAALVAEGADFRQFEGWRNLWIPNYLVLALHDTGLVGLVLTVALLSTAVRSGLRTASRWRHADPERARIVLGCVAGLISLLVAFLTSNAFSLVYPWIILGLIGAYGRFAGDLPPAPISHSGGSAGGAARGGQRRQLSRSR